MLKSLPQHFWLCLHIGHFLVLIKKSSQLSLKYHNEKFYSPFIHALDTQHLLTQLMASGVFYQEKKKLGKTRIMKHVFVCKALALTNRDWFGYCSFFTSLNHSAKVVSWKRLFLLQENAIYGWIKYYFIMHPTEIYIKMYKMFNRKNKNKLDALCN